MKTLYLIFLLFITVSCATKPTISQSVNDEYEIVRLALDHYKTMKSDEFKVLEKLNNYNIVNYYNGFYQHPFYNGSLELPGVTFSLKDNPVAKWNKKILGEIITTKKIVLIKDFDKVRKVSLNTPEKAESYFSLSNPIFSNNGEYALININIFSNLVITDSYGYILIFKKVNDKWTYIDEFTAYLT